MKKLILFGILCTIFILTSYTVKSLAIPNPWIDCEDDISCAAKKAGFNFPLKVKSYSVRAMEDMIEISFPLDKKRNVVVRKSQTYNKDISGVYENYPINKTIKLKNGVIFNVRGNKKKYYVANFAAESGYYSFYSKEGMKLKDIEDFYELIAEAEAPRYKFDETDDYSIEQLQKLRMRDGIVEPVYSQDCFPRTLEKKGVTKNCFERANLGQDSACSASQIKMIKEYYKKGYKCDPLNNGEGNFCAD